MHMLRLIGSVIFGYAVWTIVWLVGNAAMLRVFGAPEEGAGYDAGLLGGMLGLSVACSLLAGVACSGVLRTGRLGPPVVLALLLLMTGVGVQLGVWEQMPVWYHVTFLVLLVPVTLAGAVIARPGALKPTAKE